MSKTTGKSVYSSIHSQVDAYGSEVKATSSTLENIKTEIAVLERSQEKQISIIGNAHLADVISGRVQGATPEIQRIYQERVTAYDAVVAEHKAATRSHEALSQEEAAALSALERERTLLRDAQAESQSLKDAHKALEAAELKCDADQRAADSARVECRQKTEAFNQSRSFQHLLEREYGTPNYRGSLFFAWGDRWLAGKINFTESKRNYETLMRLPEHSVEVAAASTVARDDARAMVKSIFNQLETASGVSGATIGYRAAQDKKAKHESLITRIESKMGEFTGRSDDLYVEMKERIKRVVLNMSPDQIRILVSATRGVDDDAAQENLVEAKRKCESLRLDQQVASANYDAACTHHLRSKELIRYFERQGYDGQRRIYDSGFDVNSMMTGYVLGQLNQSSLDSAIRSSSIVEPEPYTPPAESYSPPSSGYESPSRSTPAWSPSEDDSSKRSSYSNSDTIGGGGDGGGYTSTDGF